MRLVLSYTQKEGDEGDDKRTSADAEETPEHSAGQADAYTTRQEAPIAQFGPIHRSPSDRDRSNGRHKLYLRSRIMAMPWPPEMHKAARPRACPFSRISYAVVSTMRAPDIPIGWPRAMAPPFGLRRS
jgi:hypothetical protein